jgi:hypothetical protein
MGWGTAMASSTYGLRARVARILITRAMAAIEVQLGEPTAWRLLQMMGAIERFRLGQFDVATIFAARAMLPAGEVPAAELAGICAPALGAVRHQIQAM